MIILTTSKLDLVLVVVVCGLLLVGLFKPLDVGLQGLFNFVGLLLLCFGLIRSNCLRLLVVFWV